MVAAIATMPVALATAPRLLFNNIDYFRVEFDNPGDLKPKSPTRSYTALLQRLLCKQDLVRLLGEV
jgi:hypothetical protein